MSGLCASAAAPAVFGVFVAASIVLIVFVIRFAIRLGRRDGDGADRP